MVVPRAAWPVGRVLRASSWTQEHLFRNDKPSLGQGSRPADRCPGQESFARPQSSRAKQVDD
jgi:hypothetical protein